MSSGSILDDPEFWDFAAYQHPGHGGVQGGAGGNATPIPASNDPIHLEIKDPIEYAAETFEPKPDYDNDPALWGSTVLGEFFWSKQTEILRSVSQNRYTAVQSCHDAGKSFIAARAAARWIAEHDPGEAFVVSTAPTSAQVSAILWREIQRAHRKGALAGVITTAGYPQWKLGGELVGYGRKPADYSDSAFQGIHARYVLVIIDEACGVTKQLYDAADALATNANARVLAIGNPDDPTSHFATVCKPDSGWNVIRIDGLGTPNFTQDAVEWMDCPDCRRHGREQPLLARLFQEEGLSYTTEYVPEGLRDMLLSPLWVEERLHRWVGLPNETQTLSELSNQSSLFTAKVRGLFPDSSSEGVIPLGWVQLAVDRWKQWQDDGATDLDVIERDIVGADIADQGEDATCLALRKGPIVKEIRKHRSADVMESTGYITAALSSRPGSLAIVDSIGVGAGVLARIRELGLPVRGFVASGSAKGLKDRTGEFKFTNLRAAAWWRMRELLDPSQPGGSRVMLPDSEILIADLTTPHWKVLSGGSIQIEPKDEIRKRLGRSTDEGDAVVMAFWQGRGTVDTAESGVLSWYDESDGSVLSWGVDEMAAKGYGS
jgi:hypothetical protein